MGRFISGDFYKTVRKKLVSTDHKIMKIGIQQLLNKFEIGYNFEYYDKIQKEDFNAKIHFILQHTEDEDVRKWLYHLLCHYNPKDNGATRDICKRKIKNESLENISWITALIASHSKDINEFESFVNSSKIKSFLNNDQIKICACAYRDHPFYIPEKLKINKSIDADDWLSQIWLTKIFANNIKFGNKSYKVNHSAVTEDVIAGLFYVDNEIVRKYSIWAFSQLECFGFYTLNKRVDFSKLDTGQQKWYFNTLFSDNDYVSKETEHAKDILKCQLFSFPKSVREGMISGLIRAGYIKKLSYNICEWFEDDKEDDPIIKMLLGEYIIKHSGKDECFKEILDSLTRNITTLPLQLQSEVSYFLSINKRSVYTMKNELKIENNYGQVVLGDVENLTQNIDHKDLTEIMRNVDSIMSDIRNIDDRTFDSKNVDDIKSELMYLVSQQLTESRQFLNQNILQKMDELNESIKALDNNKSKPTFEKIVGIISNLITISTGIGSTELFQFIKDAVSSLSKFFG